MTEHRREWLYLVLGIAIGTAWFVFNRWIDFGPYPVAADAVSYSQISLAFKNFWEAFIYAGDRTFGFPFILYLIKEVSGTVLNLSPELLEAIQTGTLLLFHFGVSILFYGTLRNFSRLHGIRLHPFALALILFHPGLVSHTSVLLTDTFTTDLIMIAIVFLVESREASNRTLALHGAATGLVLGWAVATRPFLVVSFVSIIALAVPLAFLTRRPSRVFVFLAPMIGLASLVVVPSVLNCRSIYGKLCQQNPGFAGQAVATSLQLGLTSYRTYWSDRSRWESTIVIPEDWSMVENWRTACDLGQVTGPAQWLRCVSSRPFFIPVYLGKKLIAVFDSFFLQPYASDVTPSWVRRYSRVFGTISFVGFFCVMGIFAVFLKRRMIWEALAISLPVFTLAYQLPMHVEGRYSFPAVPMSVFAVIWLFQKALRSGRRALVAYLLAVAALGGTFLIQTHLWDRDDLVLQQIEGWD